jgi:hypothetical protein
MELTICCSAPLRYHRDMEEFVCSECLQEKAPIYQTKNKTMTVEQLKSDYLDSTDGPVDEFVVLSRGVRSAYNREADAETISNALAEALQTIMTDGTIPSNEFSR